MNPETSQLNTSVERETAEADVTQLPATGATVRLSPLPAGQSFLEEDGWTNLANAGIRIRPDYTDPTRWIATVNGHRTRSCVTRDEALFSAVRWLVNEVQLQRDATEAAEQRAWWSRLLG